MELRWFVRVDKYKYWDSREDDWFFRTYKRDPILQWRDSSKDDWKAVPTIEQVFEQ